MNILIKITNIIINFQVFKGHNKGKYTSKSNDNAEVTWVRETLFVDIINGYIAGDIKRLLNIKVINNYNGNCNYPLALYVFSCMDFLGYLVAKTEYSLHGKDTKNRINTYINDVFINIDKEKLIPHIDYLVQIFRHGLTHQFFPKMAGISRENKEVFTYHTESKYLVLDADQLAKMFLRSIDNFKLLLEDKNLCTQIYNRYQKISEEDKSTSTSTSMSSSTLPTTTHAGTATVYVPPSYPNG